MRWIVLAVLLVIACCFSIFYLNQPPYVVIGGVTWTQVSNWNFGDGLYPGGWGWGSWDIVGGMLEGGDSVGDFSVYFLPYPHSEDFMLETKVHLSQSFGNYYEIHLLTRDGAELNYESGFAFFPNRNRITVRHMVNNTNLLIKHIGLENASLKEYVMRFMVLSGEIRVYLGDDLVYASTDVYPILEYYEPHLAVRLGVARFEYFKIFTLQHF